MDEIRMLVGETPWWMLLMVYFILVGSWSGMEQRIGKYATMGMGDGLLGVSWILSAIFLVLPQGYILIVLVSRLLGQDWS